MFDKPMSPAFTVYDFDYFVVPAWVGFYILAQLRKETKVKLWSSLVPETSTKIRFNQNVSSSDIFTISRITLILI